MSRVLNFCKRHIGAIGNEDEYCSQIRAEQEFLRAYL